MGELGGDCDPREVGMHAAHLERAVELVRARGGSTQLCVIREGRVVVDQAFGCEPDALFWLYSAGKPYLAILIHQLAASGPLHLDDEVAVYWPEFAHEGKSGITVRDVLRHRSGLTTAGSYLGEVRAMADWDRALRRIERAKRQWPIGTVAYSPLAFGFILGEVVRRITRLPIQQRLRESVLEPLGATDTYLGLPGELWGRHVPLRASGPLGRVVQSVVNRRSTREAVIPAAGISTTARELAGFYLMLLNGGAGTAGRVLRPESIAAAVEPSSEGEVDRFAKAPIRWSQGFQLGGPRFVPDAITPLGMSSSPRTFGHNGSNCCIGWGDPDREIAFAYLTDGFNDRSAGIAHHAAVADAVLGAVG